MASDGKKTFVGGVLVVAGVFLGIGTITGNLAPMLAALFDPKDLVNAPPKTSSNNSQGNTQVAPSSLPSGGSGTGPVTGQYTAPRLPGFGPYGPTVGTFTTGTPPGGYTTNVPPKGTGG